MEQTQLKALILGASGAVGRELVRELLASPKWSEISVIVRRKLEQWDSLPGKEKLRVLQVQSLDELEDVAKWNQFNKYDTLFCCLGSRTKEGDAQFYKVDFSYCYWGGLIGQANKIPHYSLVSGMGSDKTSCFLYIRTKGQIEEALANLKYPFFTISRPGAILNRDNDCRLVESILKYTPFISKIESKDLARAIMIDAEIISSKKQSESPVTNTLSNQNLKDILKN